MKVDIAIIGHIINETIQFPGKIIEPVLGSPVSYSSVVASVLGVKIGIATKIGRDFPPLLLQQIEEAGVDTSGITIEGPHSTRNLLIYNQAGHKHVEYLHKAPDIMFEDIPEDYRHAGLFFICPMDYEVPLETVRRLRQLPEKTVMIDLGGYGGATSDTYPSPEERREPKLLPELIQHVDIVKASIEDCRHLLDIRDEEAIGRTFVNWGAKVGMVTLGEKGAIAVTAENVCRVPPYPSKAIDATGAGDSFSAGFLVGYFQTRDVEHAVKFGCATASLVIEGSGGVLASRMPKLQQVHERMGVKAA